VAAISAAVVEAVKELTDKGIPVTEVVSDDARNEIAGIREPSGATGKPVFRIACSSITLSLALHDALAAMLP
jgi:hypothetical protein